MDWYGDLDKVGQVQGTINDLFVKHYPKYCILLKTSNKIQFNEDKGNVQYLKTSQKMDFFQLLSDPPLNDGPEM